jgi:hypothetical protein
MRSSAGRPSSLSPSFGLACNVLVGSGSGCACRARATCTVNAVCYRRRLGSCDTDGVQVESDEDGTGWSGVREMGVVSRDSHAALFAVVAVAHGEALRVPTRGGRRTVRGRTGIVAVSGRATEVRGSVGVHRVVSRALGLCSAR